MVFRKKGRNREQNNDLYVGESVAWEKGKANEQINIKRDLRPLSR